MKNLIPSANIRKTDDGMFSVIDVVKELTGCNARYAAKILSRIKSSSPEVSSNLSTLQFAGERQILERKDEPPYAI